MDAKRITLSGRETANAANDVSPRPIGELMPEVLARYGIELREKKFRPLPASQRDAPFATAGAFAELAAW